MNILNFGKWIYLCNLRAFQGALVVKNPPANAVATGVEDSIPELRRSPGGGNGNPLQYSCLGNSMDRGAWRVTVHRVAESWTQLSNWEHMYACNLNCYQNYNITISLRSPSCAFPIPALKLTEKTTVLTFFLSGVAFSVLEFHIVGLTQDTLMYVSFPWLSIIFLRFIHLMYMSLLLLFLAAWGIFH